MHERRRLLLGERGEQDRRRVDLAAAPARSAREELRPRGADDEERHAPCPLDEVVDEVEQRARRPSADPRTRGRAAARRASASRKRRQAANASPRWSSGSSPRSRARRARAKCRSTHPASASSGTTARTAWWSFSIAWRWAVRLEDAGLRLHHLAECPERHAFAVRKRAAVAPVDERRRLRSRSSGRARRRAGSCRSPGRRRA